MRFWRCADRTGIRKAPWIPPYTFATWAAALLMPLVPFSSCTARACASGVRIGRAPECELRFDANLDRAVSTLHAELTWVDGKPMLLDSGSRNGIWRNGVRVEGQAELRSGDEIRLGADGPRFTVAFALPADADVDTEDDAGTDANAIPATLPGKAPASAIGKKQSIGLNTLLGVVDQAVQQERRRTRRVLLPIAAILIAVVAAIPWWPGNESMRWRDVLAKPMQSVYVCVDPASSSPFGTAWSVGKGLLATNSHVAKGLVDGELKSLIVRSCATPPQDIRIERATLHPGYGHWNTLKVQYLPFDGSDFLDLLDGYDVALLHVHPDDIELLAPPLQIASRKELDAVEPGDALAMVGYPMEQQAGGGINMDAPFPQLRAGSASRLTNYFFGSDVPGKRRMIGMSITSAGGASGSPVFDERGRVVAVNFAGDYLDAQVGGRRIRTGGAYGQRADVLLDLIEGFPPERDALLREQLEAEFLQRYQKGIAQADALAFLVARTQLQANERLAGLQDYVKTECLVTQAGSIGTQDVPAFAVATAGTYLRVVVATVRPVAPIVSTLLAGSYKPEPARLYFRGDRLTAPKGVVINTRIAVADDADVSTPLAYSIYWYRVQ